LPLTRTIIPFSKECTAGSDVSVGVTAVIDDYINAAALFLPLLDEWLACSTFTALVVWLVGVVAVQESTKPDGTRWLAQQRNKAPRLCKVDFLHLTTNDPVEGKMPSR